MKILFIGGTGVLSRDIVNLSVKSGYDVYLLNRGSHNECMPKACHYIKGDIRNSVECKEILSKYYFDVVADFVSYNVEQIKTTIDIIKGKCTQYIFVSSICSYRRASEDFPIMEDSVQPNDRLTYGIDKYECEKYLRENEWNFEYTIVRPYITYGDTRIPLGLAPQIRYHWTIVARMLSGKPMFYWNDGGHIPKCNITHTEDFAVGFCGLFLNPKAYNEDFNIVGDEIYSWKEVFEILYDVVGLGKRKMYNIPASEIAEKFLGQKEFFTGDRNLDAIVDNSKIKDAVPQFKTRIPLRAGLGRTIEYYKDKNYLDGIDIKYDALCDRIIRRYDKQVFFVDYLGNATFSQKVKYWCYKNLDFKYLTKLSGLKKLVLKFV